VTFGKLCRRSSGAKPTLVVADIDASGGRFSVRVPVETSGNPALLPAWGRLHLRDLEDAFDGGKGNRAELNQRIIKVSLETKVLCRFTAFVAVDHEVANQGGRVHKVTQSVESPAGWGEPREVPEAPSSTTTPSNGPGATTPAGLETFSERLHEVVTALLGRGKAAVDEAIETLRLILEEAAHAGVPPAKRKVLEEALAALVRGDVDEAVVLLQPHAGQPPGGRRGGAFWG
jgi:hypothetical protein